LLEVTALGWTLTIAVILALLALDLTLGALRPHTVGLREAAAWSAFYVGVAVAFGFVLVGTSGWEYGSEYFAGYLVEKSLSVDNLFVFVIIISTFAVPPKYQQKVLTIGIVVALAMRVVFIALGATLLSLFSVVFLLFGLALILTAVQLYRHRDRPPGVADNIVLRTAKRLLTVTDDYVGGRMTVKRGGVRMVTPLLLVLIAIGSSDLLFAFDSIPAVYGVTDEPYLVFVANAFALLGLRALFFLVQGLLDRLVYLSAGLAVILAFIGVKLVLHWAHEDLSASVPEISTAVSLGVIALVLAVTTVTSLRKTRKDPDARDARVLVAHTGEPVDEERRQPR
jgi:tellurite resistance protein TerC